MNIKVQISRPGHATYENVERQKEEEMLKTLRIGLSILSDISAVGKICQYQRKIHEADNSFI